MEPMTLVIVFVMVLVLAGGGALVYVLFGNNAQRGTAVRGMMVGGANPGTSMVAGRSRTMANSRTGVDPFSVTSGDIMKKSGTSKKKSDDIRAKLFKAGYYTADDRRAFQRKQTICVFVGGIATAFLMTFLGATAVNFILGLITGGITGFVFPLARLDKEIRLRQDDALYYLPLVIEQISIGVSSGLDIGPCVAYIVEMAGERDSHNPVTEMFAHVEKLVRSGLSLEDGLIEVGEANGMTEIKHTFMFLAQCARHGGEISKQLQELADSTMMQRQVQVEGKITALPVKATGPLFMVFAGYFALLFSGIVVRFITALGNG